MFIKQAIENKKKQQIKQIQEIKSKTTNTTTPALAKQQNQDNPTTSKHPDEQKQEMNSENPGTSAVRVTPSLTVKVLGKNVTDLMSLKSFLARKKSERENMQAQNRRPTSAISDSSHCNAAIAHTLGKN